MFVVVDVFVEDILRVANDLAVGLILYLSSRLFSFNIISPNLWISRQEYSTSSMVDDLAQIAKRMMCLSLAIAGHK